MAQAPIITIPPEDQVVKPWKNGKGITRDVLLLPQGADHSSFDIRIAFAPNTERAVFSRFEGVERVLTLTKGAGLALEFADHRVALQPLQSHRFDCDVPVTGDPIGGATEVINVMARKGRWRIMKCLVATDVTCELPADALALIIPLSHDWVVWREEERIQPRQEEAVLLRGPARVFAGSKGGQCLFAELHSATDHTA